MKISQVIALVALGTVGHGFNLLGGSRTTTFSTDFAEPTISSESFNSLQSKPGFYNKFMLELKRLNDEPLCHRMAAQLLMNNCRGLQDVNEENLLPTKSRLQKNHVESFAAALTICDMEDVKMAVPQPCRAFSSAALLQAFHDNQVTLVVPADVVGACLTSLSEKDKPYMTWLSRRDTALLFCRAASIDMDKDQLFQSHKNLVQIMDDFSYGLKVELKDMLANLNAHAREADSFVEGFKSQMEHMSIKAQASFESVSSDIKNVASSIKSIKQSGADIQQFLQSLFKTAIEGNAEMAATHEQALSLSTDNLQARFEGLNEMAEKNQALTMYMASYMQELMTRIEVTSEQYDTIDKKTQQMSIILTNATELFVVHAEKIEQASLTVSRIHDNLGPVAAAGDLVSGYLKHGGSFSDLVIRIATPPSMLLLGSYGLPASMVRNALLVIGGVPVGDLIVRIRRLEWSTEWCPDSFMPPVFASQARRHARQSKLETPVENSSDLATEYPALESVHFEMP
ncbi:hypothetical protein LOCC1_G001386 [Lachnellula occidentalis]|uniref:Uncharacterized protein n=1 Tax=Lachnellula occidentalis TaxID=215460 RepID=A0A8H8S6G5_9HELO|nr:hypothetical protein LOCC1_G001386 [Lachnellula occidentalis]